MSDQQLNPSVLEEILGAAAVGITLLASPLLRPWYSRWGSTPEEAASVLPGDDQVPHPTLQNTRAMTFNAPPERVWPWLAQIGQGRGGLYSYEGLENLVGCQMRNAERILPDYQTVAVGDEIRLSAGEGGPVFHVTAVDPPHALILGADDPPTSWSFILKPLGQTQTRFLIRFRLAYPATVGQTILWRGLVDPIHFVMERQMLFGIRRRAELPRVHAV